MQADCSRKFFQCLLNSKLVTPSQASPLIEQLEMAFQRRSGSHQSTKAMHHKLQRQSKNVYR